MKKKVVGRGLIAALIAIAIILGVQYGTAWHTYRTALDFPEAAQASVVVSVLALSSAKSACALLKKATISDIKSKIRFIK